jgi:hypothetical protein
MLAYLQNIFYAVMAVAGFGLAGGFGIIPFRKDIPFILLLAPLSGLLLTTLGALAFYVILKLSMRTAGLFSWSCCCCLTFASIYAVRTGIAWKKSSLSLVVVACVTILQTTILSTVSIESGGCVLVNVDGTDQFGYTHLADWLRTRRLPRTPLDQLDREEPYQSFPFIIRIMDPRFGTFTFLSLISILSHRSGMFAYDLGCAIAISVGVLALSGLFARNWVTLLLLLAGLFTCHWFDYSRCGFFAKTLSFPASFFVAGLFFLSIRQSRNRFTTLVLTLLTASAALMQFGEVTALFLAVLGGAFVFADLIFNPNHLRLRIGRAYGALLFLLLLISTSVLASGNLARPMIPGFPDWNQSWDRIFSRVSEIEYQGTNISGLSDAQISIAVVVCLLLWLFLIGIALYQRCPEGLALLAGPFILLVVLRVTNAGAVAFQMIGVFYPLSLCGAAVLTAPRPGGPGINAERSFSLTLPVYGILILALLLHMPRFCGAFARYCGPSVPRTMIFTKSQFDELAQAIGRNPVYVDTSSVHSGLAVLVELGRRGIPIQWSPATWKLILGYRNWSVPEYKDIPKYRLFSWEIPPPAECEEVIKTNQFTLFKLLQK